MKRWASISDFLKDHLTSLLAMIPIFMGFLILVLQDKIINIWFKTIPADKLSNFTVGLAFLVWCLSFVIMIWRREASLIVRVKGKFAIIYGIIFLVICVFLGFSLIYKSIFLLR